MSQNPYHAIGLRHNPFIGEEQTDQTQNLWLDRGYSVAPQAKNNQFVQLIGEKGFGKTSHLNYWRSQTGGFYHYCPPEYWNRWQPPKIGAIAYWDEADRMPLGMFLWGLGQMRLARNTLVVGTHHDLGFWAKGFGFHVFTISLPPLDATTLKIWAIAKIKAASLNDQDCRLQLSDREALDISQKSQGSWRRAADYLHIWAAAIAFEYANKISRIRN